METLNQILDKQAKVLVGILLKRVEVLEKEGVLAPNLYKALVKENVYEQFRNLKAIIEVYLTIGKIEFKTKPREKE